ncbi:divergent polysaccharide deacetylase family protein [Maridesulfovibrio ferrireducens]|uniref:divergent polysaccharide deacetylase family protein n=1 Tax=Maridesulfovibrio ferrireducens TaxID=246191 RepID=UPI001A26F0A0|nr:divergent polysaccharide deacetylase family protein [Maridesulfovibrio ferrireducens]MBI9110424.1 divergent polysaccharide deacetylase family protein [Maridesulfovibrio ferrireducens]
MVNNTTDQNNKPETPVENPGIRAYLSKPFGIAVATIATATFICLIIALMVYSGSDTVADHKQSIPHEQQGFISANATNPYEEIEKDDLEDLVKIADLSLINTLKSADVSMSDLKLEDVTLKKHQGRYFHFQQLRFPLNGDKLNFVENIKKRLSAAGLSANIHKVSEGCWLLSINEVPTHKFFIDTAVQQEKPVAVIIDPNAPKMAIVIDDMGEDINFARGLAALDIKVTFSIWPNSSHVNKVSKIAKNSGNEIMIHLPMQPKGYPKVNPGADSLLVGMDSKTIQQRVVTAMNKVPYATGLNNHMGSRFTENLAGMSEVMIPLHPKKIFFLDSRTTAKSTARKAAKKAKVTLYERNIFLDNVKDVAAIKFQLTKAAKIARKTGQSIAIGHPNRETLEAIRQWSVEINGKIKVVPVKDLVPKS